ncbi:MAG TPA: Xaa-Pro peptidase family protein [Planctomycetota bacterium]|nr:Xaa-Pro peptidase family protein [Planctomycetota bacterium]
MRAWLVLALLALLQESPESLRLPESEFARRRAAIQERFLDGAVALDAGPLGEVGSDNNTPVFDFKYLTGFHDNEGIIVLAGKKTVVFVSEMRKAPGIDLVLPVDQFPTWVAQNLSKEPRLYTKLRGKNLTVVSEAAASVEVVGGKLRDELTRLRLIKGDAELKLMRKAADATNAAHLAAMKALKPGMNEREIQEIIVSTFRKEGCPDLGFPPIIAAGRNGTILHYMKNEKEIPKDTVIVVDIGAAIENYVTDITRTIPTSGKYTEVHRKHYQCVLDAQKAAEAVCKPGATFTDLERAARKVFEERGMTDWSYAHAKDYSVRHGLGHYVGMAVHDSGSYREKFAPGMVITIEPGWYDKDAGYGIRIEDTYVITKDGFDRLSAGAPREMDDIEAAMKGKKDY